MKVLPIEKTRQSCKPIIFKGNVVRRPGTECGRAADLNITYFTDVLPGKLEGYLFFAKAPQKDYSINIFKNTLYLVIKYGIHKYLAIALAMWYILFTAPGT